MDKNKYLPWIVAAGFVASLAVALPVFAQTPTGIQGGWGGRVGMRGSMMPGIFGTVSAVDGTTLTVTGKGRPNASGAASGTVYTVDASNAKVMKNGTTSAVSDIATGDTVMVVGTVSGTNVAATTIRDGMNGMMKGRSTPPANKPSLTPPIQGNGEPVVGGSITAISSTMLTVTNASGVIYTIDASNAKIIKNGTSTAFSNVAVGDNIVVQGIVNGTSVAASSVIDQGSGNKIGGGQSGGAAASAPTPGFHFGFFSAIGNFFKHLFGF